MRFRAFAFAFCLALLPAIPIAAQDGSRCAKIITVYIDLSGTMTGPPSAKTANLYELAAILRDGFTQVPRLVADGDSIEIFVFGESIHPFFSTTVAGENSIEELRERLTALTQNRWRQDERLSAVANSRNFRIRTNFRPVLAEIRDRAKAASDGTRRVILIASDLSHDPEDKPSVAPRIKDFDTAFSQAFKDADVRAAFVPEEDRLPAAHLVLLQLPPAKESDVRVANHVINRLEELKPTRTLFRASERANTMDKLKSTFSSPVKIESARRSGDSALAFRIENPNCGPVTIDRVLIGPSANGITEFEPFDISKEVGGRQRTSVVIDDPRLKGWAGKRLQITPDLDGGKVESLEFLFGDNFSFKKVTPELFPKLVGDGSIVLRGQSEVYADEPHEYVVVIKNDAFPPDQRTFSFQVQASGGKVQNKELSLSLEVPREVIKRLPKSTRLEYELQSKDDSSTVAAETSDQKTNGTEYSAVARLKEYSPALVLVLTALALLIAWIRKKSGREPESLALLGAIGSVKEIIAALVAIAVQLMDISIVESAPASFMALLPGAAGGYLFFFTVRGIIQAILSDRIDDDPLWRDRTARTLVYISYCVGAVVYVAMARALGWRALILETWS